MKTLSINLFNIKPTLRKMVQKPKTVEIPPELPDSLYNIIAPLQNSLNYMATNYGINFTFKHSSYKSLYVICEKNNVKANSEFISTNDAMNDMTGKIAGVAPEVARKIYEAASQVL